MTVKILKRQRCDELNTGNHQNYSRYNFSTTEIILNWNVKINEVLCASLEFNLISIVKTVFNFFRIICPVYLQSI